MKKIVLSTLILLLSLPVAAEKIIPDVTVHLEVENIQVREGEDAVFNLRLSRPLDFDIRYAYRTEDNTAKAGKDYVAENGLFVIPAGKRLMELSIKTLKDDVIDKNRFKLVLSDMETKGYGKVWGAYAWTDWWRIESLPRTKTVYARIRNVLSEGIRRQSPGGNKF